MSASRRNWLSVGLDWPLSHAATRSGLTCASRGVVYLQARCASSPTENGRVGGCLNACRHPLNPCVTPFSLCLRYTTLLPELRTRVPLLLYVASSRPPYPRLPHAKGVQTGPRGAHRPADPNGLATAALGSRPLCVYRPELCRGGTATRPSLLASPLLGQLRQQFRRHRPVVDHQPVAEAERLARLERHRARGHDARVEHGDRGEVVPQRGRVAGMVEHGDADRLAAVELGSCSRTSRRPASRSRA